MLKKKSLFILIAALMFNACGSSDSDSKKQALPAGTQPAAPTPVGFWKQFETYNFSSEMKKGNQIQAVGIQFTEDSSRVDQFNQPTGKFQISPLGNNVFDMPVVSANLYPSNKYSDGNFDYYTFVSYIFEVDEISYYSISLQFIATFTSAQNGGGSQFIPSYSGFVVHVCNGNQCSYDPNATDTANFSKSLQ